ncbi:MAG: flagellar motor protein MotB [Bryobacteraceae bacterium]|jgi:chemotaxis protein MotB
MRKRRKTEEHVNHERWLVSYADFITLLFAFFVVMFASAQADHGNAARVSESVRKALAEGQVKVVMAAILGGTREDKGRGNAMMKGPGGSRPNAQENPPAAPDLAGSMDSLRAALKGEIEKGQIQVALEPRGLVVSLREAAFFASGDDALYPGTYPSIEKIARAIAALPSQVRLEGHTDSVPIHTPRFRSNWELSAARSIAMLELLVSRFDIPPQRLAVAGYAETVPVESNDSEQGRAHNRRVDIVILNEHGLRPEPQAAAAGPR